MIAVCFSIFGPYVHARVSAVAADALYPVIGIEGGTTSTVYDWTPRTPPAGLRIETLFPGAPAEAQPRRLLCQRLFQTLDSVGPRVVAVPGWGDTLALAALMWCQSRGIPAIVMSESAAHDEPRIWWREGAKRLVMGQFSSALVGGKPHLEYAVALGIPRERIFTGYDVVDNDHFSRGAERARAEPEPLRCELGLPHQYFLASNRFIQKKNLSRLLQAYALYRGQARSDPWSLVLLGDGVLRPRLEGMVKELGLQGAVFMPGFKQYDELPAYYGLADAFIHASTTEQWGLVVNEAMAAGLPVLVSSRCGCALDLVEEGRNGYIFDPNDVESLASLMVKIASDECDRDAMGQASRMIISQWGVDRFASGMKAAVERAIDAGPQKCGAVDRLLLHLLIRRDDFFSVFDSRNGTSPKEAESKAVEKLFTDTAAEYSNLFQPERRGKNFEFRRRLAIALELSTSTGGDLLECAAGSGEITAALLGTGRFKRATVLDISPRMLEFANRRIKEAVGGKTTTELEFACADIFQFAADHRERRFNLIVCLGLIAHTGRLTELLTVLESMLAEEGAILLQSTLLDHVGVRILRNLTAERYFRSHGYHLSYFWRSDIIEAARRAGLSVADVRRYVSGFSSGDRIWPWACYYLEMASRPFAESFGAEAVFLLTKDHLISDEAQPNRSTPLQN